GEVSGSCRPEGSITEVPITTTSGVPMDRDARSQERLRENHDLRQRSVRDGELPPPDVGGSNALAAPPHAARRPRGGAGADAVAAKVDHPALYPAGNRGGICLSQEHRAGIPIDRPPGDRAGGGNRLHGG